MDGTCNAHGELKNVYKILVGKSENKGLFYEYMGE
jgi:hypothetical protein